MSVVETYNDRIVEMYLKTHPNVNPDIVRNLVNDFTNSNLRNIPCVMHNNMSHETIETSVIDTFDWIEQRNPIISGNGTFFKQHSEYLAPTVKMLEKLQANRKKKKKEMYTYQKGTVEYANANVQQLSIKVIMNADYGGTLIALFPFDSYYIPDRTTRTAKD